MNKLWCLLLVLLIGCDLGNDATQNYSGITRTDENGNVISRDDNDWKSAPVSCTDGCFVKDVIAYPNPTKSTITLRFLISRSNITVNRFFVYDNGGAVVKSSMQSFDQKGAYSEVLDLKGLPAGIYRLKFYVIDNITQVAYIVSGDIQRE